MFGEDSEWLKTLKADDEVFITARYGGALSHGIVSRVTKTMIMIGNKNGTGEFYESKFNRETGSSVGSDTWSRVFLIKPTEKIVEQVLMAKLINKANRLYKDMVIPKEKEALKEFINIIVKYVPEKKEI